MARSGKEPRYTQVKVSVAPDIAAAFKADCLERGVSMASEISRFMSGKAVCGGAGTQPAAADIFGTRGKRRAEVKKMIRRLESIAEAERQYMDRIPENLRGGMPYEAAEETLSALEEAAGALDEAY